MNDCEEDMRRYVAFFEQLEPASLQRFHEVFAVNARFRDPFNDVTGVQAIARVFAHMFATTEAPRFLVDEALCRDRTASLRWRFQCRVRGRALEIEGMSLVRFDRYGRVTEHLDYWDPAAQLYERLPLLGGLLRRIRRRLAAH